MGLSTHSQATMFPPRIFVICTSLPLVAVAQYQAQVKAFVHHELPQTGAQYHKPAPAYNAPAPSYGQPAPSYGAPAPAPSYGAPAPARGYGHPAPAAPSYGHPPSHQVHGPGVVKSHQSDPGQCHLDYVEKTEEVCVPSFKTDCDKESVAGGKVIKHHDQCYDVTKTVCTESHEIVDMEVCAYAFTARVVEAEAKLVDAVWTEACHDTQECLPGPPSHGYHAPACNHVIRHECQQLPELVPVVKPVSVKLPQPEETCIIKQVLLPRVEC